MPYTSKVSGDCWLWLGISKKKHVNIGLAQFIDKKNLKDVFLDYIKNLKENKIIPGDLKLDHIKGGALTVCPLDKTYSDRVIICGDAGGLINPLSGEGIYYAMLSAKIAAKVVSIALESGNTSEKSLSIYQKMWKNDFGKDIIQLSHYTKKWAKDTDGFIKYTKSDKKLADLVLDIYYGNKSFYKYKWKLLKRIFYVYLREIIKQKI